MTTNSNIKADTPSKKKKKKKLDTIHTLAIHVFIRHFCPKPGKDFLLWEGQTFIACIDASVWIRSSHLRQSM